MENVTSAGAMAASLALNETVTPDVHGTAAGSFFVTMAWICGISVMVCVLFYMGLPALGFAPYGIVAASFAAGWMSSIGAVAAGSVYALLQSIAMGGVGCFTVLLCIFALLSLAAGAFEAILWLKDHAAGDLHLWGSWLMESWNSTCEWVHHLWSSIPAHHKWKILYT